MRTANANELVRFRHEVSLNISSGGVLFSSVGIAGVPRTGPVLNAAALGLLRVTPVSLASCFWSNLHLIYQKRPKNYFKKKEKRVM